MGSNQDQFKGNKNQILNPKLASAHGKLEGDIANLKNYVF